MSKISNCILNLVSTLEKQNEVLDFVVYCKNAKQLSEKLKKIDGVVLTKCFSFIDAVGVKAKLGCLAKIEKLVEVSHITLGAKVFAQIEKSKKIIQVSAFHDQGFFGDGVNVAVIDTGCESHFDLTFPKSSMMHFQNFVSEKKEAFDDNGHGTFVCGLIAGNGLLSAGKFCGVAPKSRLIVLKALDEKGETSAFQILEAMEWVFENRAKFNIKVVCMSFGATPLGEGDPLVSGVEKLWRAGVVVVVAGGNSGPDEETIKSPGVSPRVITVGALDASSDRLDVALFSSRGPTKFGTKPDVIAPGVQICGLDAFEGEYRTMSGTSMSTPIVAGVCALMLEKWPNLTPDQVKMKLMQSGNKIIYDRNSEGAGVIDCSKIS